MKICEDCKCNPTYLDYATCNNCTVCEISDCSFKEHVDCVAKILLDYEYSPHPECPRECDRNEYRQKTIQVSNTIVNS